LTPIKPTPNLTPMQENIKIESPVKKSYHYRKNELKWAVQANKKVNFYTLPKGIYKELPVISPPYHRSSQNKTQITTFR